MGADGDCPEEGGTSGLLPSAVGAGGRLRSAGAAPGSNSATTGASEDDSAGAEVPPSGAREGLSVTTAWRCCVEAKNRTKGKRQKEPNRHVGLKAPADWYLPTASTKLPQN